MNASPSVKAPARLLTYNDVADLCQVSKRTVKRWVEERKIHPTRLGGTTVRFTDAEVRRFIAAGQADVTI